MPDDALPRPWPAPLPGTVRYRREYRDALGRPMAGTATITGKSRHDHDGVTIPVAPVEVKVEAGVLEVDLPADTYEFTAALRTVDGHRVDDRGSFTLHPRRDT